MPVVTILILDSLRFQEFMSQTYMRKVCKITKSAPAVIIIVNSAIKWINITWVNCKTRKRNSSYYQLTMILIIAIFQIKFPLPRSTSIQWACAFFFTISIRTLWNNWVGPVNRTQFYLSNYQLTLYSSLIQSKPFESTNTLDWDPAYIVLQIQLVWYCFFVLLLLPLWMAFKTSLYNTLSFICVMAVWLVNKFQSHHSSNHLSRRDILGLQVGYLLGGGLG